MKDPCFSLKNKENRRIYLRYFLGFTYKQAVYSLELGITKKE
jgi:hypothetical protein